MMNFDERMEQRMKIEVEAKYDMLRNAVEKILLFAENTAGSKIDIHMAFGDDYDPDIFDVTIEAPRKEDHQNVEDNYDPEKRV